MTSKWSNSSDKIGKTARRSKKLRIDTIIANGRSNESYTVAGEEEYDDLKAQTWDFVPEWQGKERPGSA